MGAPADPILYFAPLALRAHRRRMSGVTSACTSACHEEGIRKLHRSSPAAKDSSCGAGMQLLTPSYRTGRGSEA
jgi:hypothetical protein